MSERTSPRLAAKVVGDEERRAAAALMGSARTEAKRAAAVENLARRAPDQLGGRAPVPLFEIRCTCGSGDVVDGHHWKCPRAHAVKRRQAAGLDVLTGRAADGQ